jgi:hypothetical protein
MHCNRPKASACYHATEINLLYLHPHREPSNLEMQPSNLEMQSSNLEMQPSNLEMHPSNLEMHTSHLAFVHHLCVTVCGDFHAIPSVGWPTYQNQQQGAPALGSLPLQVSGCLPDTSTSTHTEWFSPLVGTI